MAVRSRFIGAHHAELIRLLHDPNKAVRERAAEAMSQLYDY